MKKNRCLIMLFITLLPHTNSAMEKLEQEGQETKHTDKVKLAKNLELFEKNCRDPSIRQYIAYLASKKGKYGYSTKKPWGPIPPCQEKQ